MTIGAAVLPWVLLVHEQQRNPGVQRAVTIAAPLPDLGLSSASVPDGRDVTASLFIEAMTDRRIVATGTISAPWVGACRRCLDDVFGTTVVDVQEVFEPEPDDAAETYRLDGDRVDLEPMVRDAVLLALPIAPLCESACVGPDPDHPVSVEGEEPAGERPTDPRWAALADIRFDDP